MQEFSSISVSSYEAGALADRLTEQSRDGWNVVAIVPAGSSITAYLAREADAAVPTAAAEPAAAGAAEAAAAAVLMAHTIYKLDGAGVPSVTTVLSRFKERAAG